jgi:hypothetical protein
VSGSPVPHLEEASSKWSMHYELREVGRMPIVRAEDLPGRYDYEVPARAAAGELLSKRYGDTAKLRTVLREDEE